MLHQKGSRSDSGSKWERKLLWVSISNEQVDGEKKMGNEHPRKTDMDEHVDSAIIHQPLRLQRALSRYISRCLRSKQANLSYSTCRLKLAPSGMISWAERRPSRAAKIACLKLSFSNKPWK